MHHYLNAHVKYQPSHCQNGDSCCPGVVVLRVCTSRWGVNKVSVCHLLRQVQTSHATCSNSISSEAQQNPTFSNHNYVVWQQTVQNGIAKRPQGLQHM